MMTIQSFSKQTFVFAFLILVAIVSLKPTTVLAQEDNVLALEEVIVTAQRREQLLQDVPVSVEVFSGKDIRKQGYRDIDDLANFSASVLILPRVQDQDVSIRGFGTTGNALTLDQAAPTFVDGIHFGRSSQTKLAFMDIESIEVLKGPQPVFFGQNAIAGAFNIRSRRPTDSWESDVSLEFGENSTSALDFGVGGPLNDNFGIRVAGKYDTSDGYLKDVVSGDLLGDYENIGGRLMLQWEPTDSFFVNFKFESSAIRKDSETTSLCRTAGPLIYGRGGPLDDPGIPPGDENSIWFDPPDGTGWSVSHTPLDTDCFSSNKGVSNGGPYFIPPDYIREGNSNVGSLDIREAAEAFTIQDRNKTTLGYEDIDADNGYLELAYVFDNGVTAEWLSGWSNFDRDYGLDNTNGPYLFNFQGRGENFGQLSSELRFTSSGDGPIEWMAGAYWQKTNLFAWSSSLRANVRRGQRYNIISEDVEYKSLFGTVTFNFMDDKMSLDIGARYADIDKVMSVISYGATWVFDVEPVSAGVGGGFGCTDDDAVPCDYAMVDPTTARIFLPVAPGATLWTINYRDSRNTPIEWLPSNARPVGLTAPDFNAARLGGPYINTPFTASEINPQITLRYRHNDDITYYFRYAESFKIGGFDTGQTSVPRSLDALVFDSEDAETFEFGVKGTAWDGRFGFEATLFELEFPNLQTTTISSDPEQTSESINAGQRVRGLEFNLRLAASENLLLTLAGAFMDGVMTEFPGAGCTDAEIGAALTDPNAPCKLFDGDVRQLPPLDAETAFDDYDSFIDRGGSDAPRTPDWKFILSADYQVPIGDRFQLYLNAKGYVSDGYILNVESFSQVVKYNKHEDLNLMVGLGDIDGKWTVSVFARNLLEARPSYNAQFDLFPNGVASTSLGPSNFTTYGVKFDYSLR